jgi:hypothetical protein
MKNSLSKKRKKFFWFFLYLRTSRGFASLPMVMSIIILIIAVVVAISAVSLSEIFISAGQNQSASAYVYAVTGARDALIKIARNYTYNCATSDCYSIDFSPSTGCGSSLDGCAKVQVTNVSSPATIISKGLVKNKTRKIRVDVAYNDNGQITSTAWQEVTN